VKTYGTKASTNSFVLAQIRKAERKGRSVFLFHGWENKGKLRKKRPKNFINDFTQDWFRLLSAGRSLWFSGTPQQCLKQEFSARIRQCSPKVDFDYRSRDRGSASDSTKKPPQPRAHMGTRCSAPTLLLYSCSMDYGCRGNYRQLRREPRSPPFRARQLVLQVLLLSIKQMKCQKAKSKTPNLHSYSGTYLDHTFALSDYSVSTVTAKTSPMCIFKI